MTAITPSEETPAKFASIRESVPEWVSAWGIGLIALFFRIWHLGSPKGFVFDEVYYAQNADSLLHHAVELDPKTNAAQFIVHPPIGKWVIALGIKIFGYHEFGWRISAAIVGTASIIMIFYVAKRLFNNYFVALSAEILMAADGLHLVMSRTALLDIFLMFFTLLGFYFLLRTQHYLAGITLGLAAATKWSGLYYLVAYFAFTLYVDYRNNTALEIPQPIRTTLREKLWKRFLQYLVIPVFIYVSSWVGWFATLTGYDRQWAKTNPASALGWIIPGPVRSFWHYHWEMWNFHTNLTTSHPYSANPWSWLILGRPTSFYYQAPAGCGAKSCAQEVLALGTPILWWSAIAAIAVTFGYWIAQREWQTGLLLLSFAAGYLPWFNWQKRTVFSFYAIAFEPFVILIIAYTIWKFLESYSNGYSLKLKRRIVSGYLVIVVINFIYFLPLYLGINIPYSHWSQLMWFPNWI